MEYELFVLYNTIKINGFMGLNDSVKLNQGRLVNKVIYIHEDTICANPITQELNMESTHCAILCCP